VTSRRELEERVDELAAAHSGRAFADAIRVYSETLGDEEKEQLQRILVERSIDFDKAVMERVDARGWFRRQWDRAAGVDRERT
jgi:CHASE3 domain sensor protein